MVYDYTPTTLIWLLLPGNSHFMENNKRFVKSWQPSQSCEALLWTILMMTKIPARFQKPAISIWPINFAEQFTASYFSRQLAKPLEIELLIDWIKPLWDSFNSVWTSSLCLFYCSLIFLSDHSWVETTWWSTRWK